MTNKKKGRLIKAAAVGIDVVPVAIAILCMFPIWVHRDSSGSSSRALPHG